MMLDKKQFDYLVETNDFELSIMDNHYYDTNQDNSGLRIRNIDDLYILTYKVYLNQKVYEYEYLVPTNDIKNEAILAFLNKQGIKDIPKYLGFMQTSRYYLKLQKGEICLDRSYYLGKVDYEIEYEVYDENSDNQELISFLEKAKITYHPNQKTKYQRFKEVLYEKG